jgi:hypothetical protein
MLLPNQYYRRVEEGGGGGKHTPFMHSGLDLVTFLCLAAFHKQLLYATPSHLVCIT